MFRCVDPVPQRETSSTSRLCVIVQYPRKWLEFYCPVRWRNGGRISGSFSCSPTCVRSRISTSSSPRILAKTSRKLCSSSDSLRSKGCVCSWQTTVPWRSRVRFSRRLYRVSRRPLRFWTRECLTVEFLSSPNKNVSRGYSCWFAVDITISVFSGSCCIGAGP